MQYNELILLNVGKNLANQVYIVYLGHNQNRDHLLTSQYHVELLSNVFESKADAKQAMLYSYKHSFSGFAATLNSSQATILANTKGVISVFRSKTVELHTTRSWDFMGLSMDYSRGTSLQLAYGDNIIVGVFDTGIWPESASFKEEPGIGPVPNNWKGKCMPGDKFNPAKHCNRKLIGARYYLTGFERRYGALNKTGYPEYRSARDSLGHGTHTASTAVGSRAKYASLFGFAQGIARGGSPRARLAVYKICWNRNFDGKCTEEDILAAFDEALHDGVHIISASFGLRPPLMPFFNSSSGIGSFHAMQLGVPVVFSAGNNGPDPSLVGNVNPWSICVAASTIDRRFPTKILLDDSISFMGEGLITKQVTGKLDGAKNYFFGGVGHPGNLRNRSAAGIVILCFSTVGPVMSEDAEAAASRANAAGLIFVQPLTRPIAAASIIPVVRIDIIQGSRIDHYLALSQNLPTVEILPSVTTIRSPPAPVVSDFSSRGPSSISPDFLKPDISAPGINILAAWPPNIPPTVFSTDTRSVNWNLQSGTSMSCPHVSGIIALIKSAHPDWSPAAIRSALMTTAHQRDITGDSIQVGGSTKASDPFDIGAGHVNPLKAIDPGLIYDMNTRDYIIFLCNIGYTEDQIKAMVICPFSTCARCCREKKEPNTNINYPSISVSNLQWETTIKRSVRNVGHKKTAIYFVSTVNPDGVEVDVWPRILIFSPFKAENSYFVTLKPVKASRGRYDFGSITWSDGFHHVRSPLVVQLNTTTNAAQVEAS
ncbi:Subtilisin-like serine endopeptidase family protein [Abeliophyllum distichum]|uniref:Subtilisin-like serine endopeptidase family protein n=1 Tax=Abeliophyllum distichum TaxID=126358 RepID=A0ABD1Q2D5_9LAMI